MRAENEAETLKTGGKAEKSGNEGNKTSFYRGVRNKDYTTNFAPAAGACLPPLSARDERGEGLLL